MTVMMLLSEGHGAELTAKAKEGSGNYTLLVPSSLLDPLKAEDDPNLQLFWIFIRVCNDLTTAHHISSPALLTSISSAY